MGNKINLHKRCIGIAMFLLLVFGVINNLKAQQIFQKEYSSNTNEYGKDLIKFNDSSYFFLGSKINSTGLVPEILLFKTDTNFIIQWSKSYGDSLRNIASKVIKVSDTSLILIGGRSSNNASALLLCLNQDGDSIWSKEYCLLNQNIQLRYLNFYNDTLILYGTSSSPNSLDITSSGVLFAIDTKTGNQLWTKKFNLNSHLNTIFDNAKAVQIGDERIYYFLGTAMKDTSNQFYNYDTFLLRMNDDLNNEKLIILTDSTGGPLYSKIDISQNNNDILVSFLKAYSFSVFYAYNCLAVFDSSLNLKWANKYEQGLGFPTFDIIKYIDSSNNILASFLSYIYKLDSLGNLIKVTNIYYNPTWPNGKAYFSSIYSKQNNLFWFGSLSHIPNSFNNNYILVSTDIDGVSCVDNNQPIFVPTPIQFSNTLDSTLIFSNFSLNTASTILNYSTPLINSVTTCLTTTTNTILTDDSNIKIYPNPFHDKISVKNLKSEFNQEITIYNSSGQLVYNERIINRQGVDINLSNLPQGCYYFIIENNNKVKQYFKLIKI